MTREIAQSARHESQAQSNRAHKRDLIRAARVQFEQISGQLRRTILDAAPQSAAGTEVGWTWKIALGESIVGISDAYETDEEWLGKDRLPLDVLLHACIAVGRAPHHGYSGRAHSLWFCDAETDGRYAWYETAFVGGSAEGASEAFRGFICRPYERLDFGHGYYTPIAAPPHDASALLALEGSLPRRYYVEWPFTSLNGHGLYDFINRWASWLAESAQGRLRPQA